MALLIPPGFAQVVFEHDLVGDPETMITTLGVELDSASGANADDIANDMLGAYGASFQGMINSGYVISGVTAYVGQDGPAPLVVTSDAAGFEGDVTGAVLPPNCAVLCRKRTDLAGRRGRGRMYIPGAAEGTVDEVGNLTTVSLTAWQQSADAFYDRLTSAIGARWYPPVVLHRSEGIGTEPAPTPITQFVVERKIATQRRRLRP